MKRLSTQTFLFAVLLIFSFSPKGFAQVPELMYYVFEETGLTVTNTAQAATAIGSSATLNGNLTQGGTGQFGTGLQGGASSATSTVNTNTLLNLGTNPWTISMWLNGVVASSTIKYLFGTSTAGSSTGFRCFTGGAAGVGGITLRGGTSMTNVTVSTGVFDALGSPVVVTFVYDPVATAILVYKNGVFLASTTQSAAMSLTTASNFLINPTGTTGLLTGETMDEFRFYNRALTATEIAGTFGIPLPLKLTSFNAEYKDRSGVITWRSANNNDIDRYVIERSPDGINFNAIATVSAMSSADASYIYLDKEAGNFRDNMYLFYRVRVIEKNGSVVYSSTKRITIVSSDAAPFTIAQNPFVSDLQINTSFSGDMEAAVALFDQYGKLVYQKTENVSAAVQQISIPNLGSLPPGIYYFSVKYGGDQFTAKVAKQ